MLTEFKESKLTKVTKLEEKNFGAGKFWANTVGSYTCSALPDIPSRNPMLSS